MLQMLKPEDAFYIDSTLAGDTPAFAVLVERHKINVFNICYRVLGNREEAEEVAQDVFLKAYEKLETFKREAKFSTWLFRIAYNMSISHQRKHRKKPLTIDDYYIENYSEDAFVEVLEKQSEEEREAKLKSSIEKLNTEHQLLLQLYYSKDLSINEIAQITSLSSSNVKIKIHRARQRLFQLMQDADAQTKTA